MSYLDSIQEGMRKAEESDRTHKEVVSIFREINKELNQLAPEDTSVKIRRSISVKAAMEIFSDTIKGVTESSLRQEDKLELVLQKNGATIKSIDVALWSQKKEGYPCQIKYEGEEINCFTKEELVSGLKELFASVTFGKALMQLLSTARDSSVSKG